MKYYNVSYYCGNDIWSANIAHAESKNAVRAYYSKKSDKIIISEAKDYEIETAKRKGMPILIIG